MNKLKIAVVFGGPSPEHDVSLVGAQQLMDASDCRKHSIVPIYCDFEGKFFTAPGLRNIENFRPKPSGLREVYFAWGEMGPCIKATSGKVIELIDCVIPVFHGSFGEDGRIQGLLENTGIPTTGFSASNSAIAMRKDVTKALVQTGGTKVLPHIVVNQTQIAEPKEVCTKVSQKMDFPVIVKPVNLGSSIGVGIANDETSMISLIQSGLRLDHYVMIEPKVENLQEYNVAMISNGDKIQLSAIERPKSDADLLDFKEKYLSSGHDSKPGEVGKLGNGAVPSQGMLSLTRDINPDISNSLYKRIYEYSISAFSLLGLRGAPRIDFLYNTKTDELWLNEINPIPGSYGFFLWEAATPPLLFPELIQHLIDEALFDSVKHFEDPVPPDAYLLPR